MFLEFALPAQLPSTSEFLRSTWHPSVPTCCARSERGGGDNTPLRYRALDMTIIKWKTLPVVDEDEMETAQLSFTRFVKLRPPHPSLSATGMLSRECIKIEECSFSFVSMIMLIGDLSLSAEFKSIKSHQVSFRV